MLAILTDSFTLSAQSMPEIVTRESGQLGRRGGVGGYDFSYSVTRTFLLAARLTKRTPAP
jgi:hypothetical protein